MPRTAQSGQRADQEPPQRVATNDAAPRQQLKLVWSADGSNAPAVLEPGAAPHMVAFYRGYMCGTGGQVEQALGLFQEAVALKPDYAEALYNLGWTLAETGQLQEATAVWRKAVALMPDFAQAHYNLGWTLAETGQLLEAIAAYREAIALMPDFAQAHFSLARTLGEAGQLPEAIDAWRKAVALTPDDAEVHHSLGWALAKTGQLPEAIDAWCKAVALKPDFADAYCNLGVALGEVGHFPEAIAVLRKARKVEKDINEKRKITLFIKGFTKKAKEFEFVESNNSIYTEKAPPSSPADTPQERMGEPETTEDNLVTLARKVPSEKRQLASDFLQTLVDDTATETTFRDLRERLTTVRLKAAFRELVSEFSNPALSQDERRRVAKNLVQTFDRARDRAPDFEDDSGQVGKARSLVNKAQYQRRKKTAAVSATP